MSTTIKTLISILGVAFLLSSPIAGAADAPKADPVKACKEKCKKGDDACMKKCEPKEEKKK
ncbi:MAG: hypothetical protein HY942_03135 [Gammaproteobacteria bacterium]|nr:hypothetical protein [Gammaproteobacteria bacterium]